MFWYNNIFNLVLYHHSEKNLEFQDLVSFLVFHDNFLLFIDSPYSLVELVLSTYYLLLYNLIAFIKKKVTHNLMAKHIQTILIFNFFDKEFHKLLTQPLSHSSQSNQYQSFLKFPFLFLFYNILWDFLLAVILLYDFANCFH